MLPTGLKVVSSVVDDKEVLSVAKLDREVVVVMVTGSSAKFSNPVGGTLLPPDTRTTSYIIEQNYVKIHNNLKVSIHQHQAQVKLTF